MYVIRRKKLTSNNLQKKWQVQIKGIWYSYEYEISVVRRSNMIGQLFWGYFSKSKILICQNSKVNPKTLTEIEWNKAIKKAKKLAGDLNKKDIENTNLNHKNH